MNEKKGKVKSNTKMVNLNWSECSTNWSKCSTGVVEVQTVTLCTTHVHYCCGCWATKKTTT